MEALNTEIILNTKEVFILELDTISRRCYEKEIVRRNK
jgi:hypothetical protein